LRKETWFAIKIVETIPSFCFTEGLWDWTADAFLTFFFFAIAPHYGFNELNTFETAM
jgi:hypothetical protein